MAAREVGAPVGSGDGKPPYESYCMLYLGTVDGTPQLSCVETPLPVVLGADEIIGRVGIATVCGSDIHTLTGKRHEAVPSVLGHEAVVEVVRSNRAQFRAGQRVTFSIGNSCMECHLCRSGMSQKCPSLKKYGHSQYSAGSELSGCYASHILLGRGTTVVAIPSSLPDSVVAPANCALATMVNAVERVPRSSHRSVALVQGAGLLGVYGIALLREGGYETVYCSDVNQDRLDTVAKFGATPILIGRGAADEESIKPGSVDAVFEVCGQKSALREGFQYLKPGGHYVLVGLVHPDSALPFTAEDVIRKCATIAGVHNYNGDDLITAVEFLSSTVSKYPYELLLSPPYKLTELSTAIEAAKKQEFQRISLRP